MRHDKHGRTWETIVGYTLLELKTHLETLFTDGMNWDNYGKWEIDHIIPDSFFKYTKIEDEEFKKCWALSNIQPLWAIDNIKKGASLPE